MQSIVKSATKVATAPFTLGDCMEFCHIHQRRRAPNGKVTYRDRMEWGRLIVSAAKSNKLYTVANKDRMLIGVCIAADLPVSKIVWISEIVCIEDAFSTFIRTAFERFPGYSISGNRFGKTKVYTKENLYGRRPA